MSGMVADEVRRRNEQASGGYVLDALRLALRDALGELAGLKGEAHLDAFLARRLALVESLRSPRPGEPPGLTDARARNAAAVEAALRDVVQTVQDGRRTGARG